MAAHTESDLLRLVRLECDAGGLPLPGWSGTLGVGQVVAVRLSQHFLQNRLPSAQLRHHGKKLLPIVGDATIGNVVTVPAASRIEGIKLGQGDLADAAGHAIDQQPSTTLPHPTRSQGRFGRECVIEAKYAAHHEQTIGDIMRNAGRVLLQPRIDEESADLQLQRLPFCWANVPLGRGPLAERDDVWFRQGAGSARP